MEFNISGIPEDLPPGKYATRITNTRWVASREGKAELIFEFDYKGPFDPEDPCLLPFTKDEPITAEVNITEAT